MNSAELLVDISKKLEVEYRDIFQELGEEIGEKIRSLGYVEGELGTKLELKLALTPLEVILRLAILDTVDPNYYAEVKDD